jgi:hypothetical protein
MKNKNRQWRLRLMREGAASVLDLTGEHNFNTYCTYSYRKNIAGVWSQVGSYFDVALKKFDNENKDRIVIK